MRLFLERPSGGRRTVTGEGERRSNTGGGAADSSSLTRWGEKEKRVKKPKEATKGLKIDQKAKKKEYLYTQRKRSGAVTEGDGKPTHPEPCTSGARYYQVASLPSLGRFSRGKARPRGRNSVRVSFPRTGGEGLLRGLRNDANATEGMECARRGHSLLAFTAWGPPLPVLQGVAVGPPPFNQSSSAAWTWIRT